MCEHAKRFPFGSGNGIDFRDVVLHATMVVGFSLGFKYNKVNNMAAENVTEVSDMEGSGSIPPFIPELIKIE